MKPLQTAFVALWAAVVLFALLCEINLLPTAYIVDTPVAVYATSLLCIVTAVAGSFFACRLLVTKRAAAEINVPDEAQAAAAWKKWNARRLMLNAVAIVPSAFIYYAQSFSQTSLYCLLIALTASLLCWPAEREKSGDK